MDELIKYAQLGESVTPVVTVWAVIVGLLLSATLTMAAGLLYRRVNREASYSQGLVHSFILMGMVTCLIMILIGSNIARAFSLVGALSIIRFRTAIKSPTDTAFLFMSIALGMACGTGFFLISIVGFVVLSLVMLLVSATNFGATPASLEHLLSATFHLDVDYEKAIEPVLTKLFSGYSFAYAETIRQGTMREVVYSVQLKPGVTDKQVVDEVVRVNDNLKVTFRTIKHAVEIP